MNHDIDRTQVGFAQGAGHYGNGPGAPVLSEEEHMNLATGLMEVNSEQELDQFLGDVISGAANAVGKFISSPTGQALGSGLKDAAKQLLPMAGTAVGDYFGGAPGGQIGGALGTAAAGLFEAEAEEQDWEAANTFVKLASEAVKNAADMPQGGDPHAIAHKAIVEAAKIHAPHLVSSLTGGSHGPGHCSCHHHHDERRGEGYGERHGERHHEKYGEEYGERPRHSGRWFRHGKRIILVGV
jgi:hypothetical protein